MLSNKLKAAISTLAIIGVLLVPNVAVAQEAPSTNQNPEPSLAEVLRTPMPVKRFYTYYTTARSAITQGFAYIYLKADATIDAQNNRVMALNGAWSYYDGGSRNFERWEQLSLQLSYGANSIWVKATGYAYFKNPSTGLAEKMYLEVEHTWTT